MCLTLVVVVCLGPLRQALAGDAITGRVVSAQGKPVPGAAVKLYYRHEQTDFGSRWLGEARADGKGGFKIVRPEFDAPVVFLGRPVRRVYLVALAAGHAAGVAEIRRGKRSGYAIELPKGHSLVCSVVGADAAPVRGAVVTVKYPPETRGLRLTVLGGSASYEPERVLEELYQGKTDAKGRVTIRDLPPRQVMLQAEHEGKGVGLARSRTDDNAARIILRHERQRVAGVVTDAETGKPIPGMLVSATVSWGTVAGWALSDGQGRYVVDLGAAPAVMVRIRGRGGAGIVARDPAPAPRHASTSARLSADLAARGKLALQMKRGRAVLGNAVDARTGRAVSDAVVMLYRSRVDRAWGGIPEYRRTGADGGYSFRLADNRAYVRALTAPPGYVLTGRSAFARVRAADQDGRARLTLALAPEVRLAIAVRLPDGAPAARAQVFAGQSAAMRAPPVETDAQGLGGVQGLAAGSDLYVYAISLGGDFAGVRLLRAVADTGGPVELALRPARAGKIALEGPKGERLAGMAYVEAAPPDGWRLSLRLKYLRIERDAAGWGARVAGLLPGVEYVVRGSAGGRRLLGDGRGVKWRFAENEINPEIILKFGERGPEPGQRGAGRRRLRRRAATPRVRTPDDLKRDIGSLKDVVWQKQDPVQKHLTWYAQQVGLAIADSEKNTLTVYKGILGHEEIRLSAIAFGPNRVWVGTDKGLIAWDRRRQYWSLFAVGGTHMDAPVADMALEPGGRLSVTVRPEGLMPQTFDYDLKDSRWSER